ncbi:DUF4421 domain-containing protein [Neolewinella aurantiaca]|uniref:DUF4421 domain-containing protein n=1 Tax=Neolewinella aurantiaca TaxID=2602767 RepID=A0A5C7G1J9_9BACT|nr:DUF4421 family protein [Neolewinella aurantiaca]TXF91822.1 DUF4421 domain-containing protein [Neolewinella aurantiaca]
MRFLFIFVLVYFFGSTQLFAQRDSSFIEHFSNQARINTGFRYRDRSLEFVTSSGEELKLENEVLAFRIGGRYKFASYTFSIPVADLSAGANEEKGKNLGLGLTLFLRQHLLSGSFRSTKGFSSIAPDGERTFREDVDLFSATLYGFHVFNHKRFSLRSSFKQRDRQLKSYGSFLGGALFDRRLLTSDGLLVPLENGEEEWLTRLAQTKIGLGVGYAHTFILGKRVFITPFAIVGPEFRFINTDNVSGKRKTDNLRISPRLRGYLAIGWNGDKTAVSLNTLYFPGLDITENLDTRFDNFTVELRVTCRLQHSAAHKKKN